jgi:hypothetical protein
LIFDSGISDTNVRKTLRFFMLRASTWVTEENAGHAPDGEQLRLRALERLYLCREAVDALIRSLEAYQQAETHKAPCVPINAGRKWS